MLAQRDGGRELWRDDTGGRTWADFGAVVGAARQHCREQGVRPGEIVLTPGETKLESLAWLFAVAGAGAIAAPLRTERLGELPTWLESIAIGGRVEGDRFLRLGEGTTSRGAAQWLDELRQRGHPGLILSTGGTTGTPKLVLHDLTALLAAVPVKSGREWRTLPLMRFDHIGGLDMAWRALAGGQVLVAPPAVVTPEAVAAIVARQHVEVMPATPSFLNLLLLAEVQRTHDLSSLQVVPYGAEPMPPGLLARLRAAFPAVEFLQRFGTSETGVLPTQATAAGLVLDPAQTEFAWKVTEGELWIRSPARALGYLAGDRGGLENAGWFRTGDLAEVQGDGSVRVLGRHEELINVGGEKVLPATVEALLLTHPLVADCRVLAAPHALLGQVVVAEVVWRGGEQDPVAVKNQLHGFAASALPKCNLPVTVRLVRVIDTTLNLKKSRSSDNETTRDHRGGRVRS